MAIKKYYLKFIPQTMKQVDYVSLLKLYSLASYNEKTQCYDTITVNTKSELAELLGVSSSKVGTFLDKDVHHPFFSWSKKDRQLVIVLNNKTHEMKETQQKFLVLSEKDVSFLLEHGSQKGNKKLCAYFIYLKYYCGLAAATGSECNFTTKQFLQAAGYSKNDSGSAETEIDGHRALMEQNGFILVRRYKDGINSRCAYSWTG